MLRTDKIWMIFLVLLSVAASLPADAAEKDRRPATHLLPSSVIGAGGSPGSDGSLLQNGTLGQSTPIGCGSNDEATLCAGFWCVFLRLGPASGLVPFDAFWNELMQNSPNPFNPRTTIRFSVAEVSLVSLSVFNIQGRKIKTLVDAIMRPGLHSIVWDATDEAGDRVASGVYHYRAEIGRYSSVKKMLVLK